MRRAPSRRGAVVRLPPPPPPPPPRSAAAARPVAAERGHTLAQVIADATNGLLWRATDEPNRRLADWRLSWWVSSGAWYVEFIECHILKMPTNVNKN